MFNHKWYWDDVGTHQINHRLTYLGLHNKYGRYQWEDGTQMG